MAENPAFPTHQVGPDEFDSYDWNEIRGPYEWLVYWYKMGSYEGSGLGIAKRPDGRFDIGDLGHCSCYGPAEHWPDRTVSLEELRREFEFDPDVPGQRKRLPDDYDYAAWEAVQAKVNELLQKET